jgi:hypothetical protein
MYIATTDSYATGSKTAITIEHSGSVAINRNHLTIGTISNSSSDTDKFLVSNNGQVQYRTGDQVRSDIGAGTGSGTMSSWKIDSDSGSGTITNGATMKIAGGTNITTSESGGVVTASFVNNSGYITSNSVGNATISLQAGTGLTGGGSFTTNQTSNQTIIFNASGGGGGTIGGSGTAGFVPRFSAGTTIGNSNIQNDGTNTIINTADAIFQVTKPGNAEPSFYVDTSLATGKVGIRTNTPASALDCYGNANFRNILNVGGTNQYLFVGDAGTSPVGYVRMGYYGQGADYDSSGGAQSSVQYTSGFSNGGKVCEDERIMTFKLTRTQMANLTGTGQKTLIPQNSNFNYIVKEAYLYQVNVSGGTAPAFNGSVILQYQCSHGGVTSVSSAFFIGNGILNNTRNKRKNMIFGDFGGVVQTGIADVVPRAAVVLISNGGVSTAGSGTVDYYLRMRVKNIDFNDDIKNNSQLITVT